MKIYQVGGSVRDSFLFKKSNDLDYVCECESYDELKTYLKDNEYTIILEKPEFLIIRTKKNSEVIDFSICRKDGVYTDNRHPDKVTMGTIYDDLERRDFTINSIAKHENGDILDPNNGIEDINNKIIKCVGSIERLREDGLRVIRALRFSIQLDFNIDESINNYILNDFENDTKIMDAVHSDRLRQEITKMLKYDCYKTILLLTKYEKLFNYLIKTRGLTFKIY